MSKIKAAAIQMKCSTNPKESLSHAEEMVREAAANGANVILLPELFAAASLTISSACERNGQRSRSKRRQCHSFARAV